MSTPVYDGVIYDQSNQYEQDSKLYVQFFKQAVQNNFRSEKEGRPIFDELHMIRILTPGSRDVFVGKATPPYQQRFPKQWAAYKQGEEQPLEGTPLDEVPFLTVGQRAELKAINVRTLEQLAHMPDVLAQQVMGNFGLRQKAQSFIALAKEQAPAAHMQAELAKRDEEIETLKKLVAELASKSQVAPPAPAPKPAPVVQPSKV